MIGFIFMLCVVCHSILAEPRCSKFEYEERTLEKMIRTEILVEQVLSDIKSVKLQTSDAVNGMENMKLEMREEFNSMVEENNKKISELKNAENGMETMKNEIREELNLKLEENNKKIDELKGQLATKPNVLFFVKDPSTQDPGNGKIIVFKTVMSDTTGSYDKTTGQFTAPVNGSYLFTAQLCLNFGEKYIHYAIVAGNKQVANTLLYDKTERFCNTAQAVVILEKGQNVHILSRTASSSPLRDNHSYEWNTFSGILIK